MFEDVYIKPQQGDCQGYEEVDLQVRIHFESADKQFYGLPVIVTGNWPVVEVKKLTALGVMCIVDPADPDILDWYAGGETHRTIYPFKGLEQFRDFYESVTDKTAIKYAMVALPGSHSSNEWITERFRQHFPSVVLFGTDMVDGGYAKRLDGLDAVWLGNQSFEHIESVTGVALGKSSAMIEEFIGGKQRLIVDFPLRNPGEAAKALALGADFVVMGRAMSSDGYTVEMLLDGLKAACAFSGVSKLADFYDGVFIGRRS